jgi:hypothetical protein
MGLNKDHNNPVYDTIQEGLFGVLDPSGLAGALLFLLLGLTVAESGLVALVPLRGNPSVLIGGRRGDGAFEFVLEAA